MFCLVRVVIMAVVIIMATAGIKCLGLHDAQSLGRSSLGASFGFTHTCRPRRYSASRIGTVPIIAGAQHVP